LVDLIKKQSKGFAIKNVKQLAMKERPKRKMFCVSQMKQECPNFQNW